MKRHVQHVIFLLVCHMACGAQADAAEPVIVAVTPAAASHVTEAIKVSGAVENVLTLRVADLRNFPAQQVSEVPLQSPKGALVGVLRRLKGVRLRDILARAVIVSHDHHDVKKMVIIAGASDG